MAKRRKSKALDDDLPWVKLYHQKWLTSEARFSMNEAERGVYWDLLMCQYSQGSLPSDPAILANLAAVPFERFKQIWNRVGKEFEPSAENPARLVQSDAEAIRNDCLSSVKSWRRNGLRGGRPKNQVVNQVETKRLTKSKPLGQPSASTLLYSSKHSPTQDKSSTRANRNPDFEAVVSALESQHPEGHNPRPQLTVQMVISRCETADDCAAIVQDHAAWLPAWLSGRSVDDLHNWVSKWERGAIPPKPQTEKRTRTADTLGAWVAAAPEAE